MSIWIAGLLAVLILVGGFVVFALIVAGIVRLMEVNPDTVTRIVEVLFGMFVAICGLGTLAGLWYIALSWLMGWSL